MDGDFRIRFEDPRSPELELRKESRYPREMRLCIEPKYQRAVLLRGDEEVGELKGRFYVLVSRGYISLMGAKMVEIEASIGNVEIREGNPRNVSIISKPLTLKDIHEIDETLGQNEISVYWDLHAYGLLDWEEARNLGVPPGALLHAFIASNEQFRINHQEFVEKVLQPADMLRRVFVEVTPEPIDDSFLNQVSDPSIRDALKFLLSKQKILQELLEKLHSANTSSNYRNIIADTRNAIEGLVPNREKGKQVFEALKNAYKTLAIIREANTDVLDDVIDETLKRLEEFSRATFRYASALGSHTTQEGRHYVPYPRRDDAEFVILQAMIQLNYMIKVLKAYAVRT